MSQQAATIESLPKAFAMIKTMQAEGLEWSEGYREAGRDALTEIIEGRMSEAVDRHLDRLAQSAANEPDRRNGYYQRRLLSELGDIELAVPRTRCFSPTEVLRAYPSDTKQLTLPASAGQQGAVRNCVPRKGGTHLMADQDSQ